MEALIVSLESFQKGEIPEEVKEYIEACKTEPFIILDESSKIKTNEACREDKKSKRTQAILKLSGIGHRCILTGTFMSKSPVNAYDQMSFLKKGFFPENIFSFASRYLIQRRLKMQMNKAIPIDEKTYKYAYRRLNEKVSSPYIMQGIRSSLYNNYGLSPDDMDWIKEHKDYTVFKHLDELWGRIGDTLLKVDRKEILDLPPVIYKKLSFRLTDEQKKLYRQLYTQHCTDNITVEHGAELYIRFQDICNGFEPVSDEEGNVSLVPLKSSPKIELLSEVIDDIEGQAVVWCSRTALLYKAKERLEKDGYTVGVYDGLNKERQKDYDAFAEGKIKVILCNQASAGYGLDGLKKCNYAIYLCNSYSVEQRIQSEHRTDRGMYTESKCVIDITSEGTCEDKVTEALKQGKELVNSGTTPAYLFMLDSKEEHDA